MYTTVPQAFHNEPLRPIFQPRQRDAAPTADKNIKVQHALSPSRDAAHKGNRHVWIVDCRLQVHRSSTVAQKEAPIVLQSDLKHYGLFPLFAGRTWRPF